MSQIIAAGGLKHGVCGAAFRTAAGASRHEGLPALGHSLASRVLVAAPVRQDQVLVTSLTPKALKNDTATFAPCFPWCSQAAAMEKT